MELIPEMAGIFISLLGVVFIALAKPIPRQIQRWHVHAIERVEPVMVTWLARAIGISLVILGLVTIASPL